MAGSGDRFWGHFRRWKHEVDYTALASVKVDLESGDVVAVGIGAPREDDGPAGEFSVSLEGETVQLDEVFDRSQQRRPAPTLVGRDRSCRIDGQPLAYVLGVAEHVARVQATPDRRSYLEAPLSWTRAHQNGALNGPS